MKYNEQAGRPTVQQKIRRGGCVMKELYNKALSSLSIASLRSTKVKAEGQNSAALPLHGTACEQCKKGTGCVSIAIRTAPCEACHEQQAS